MKYLLLLAFLLPFVLSAQKVTKETEPITGQHWWVTNEANLGRIGLSPLYAYFRSAPQGTLLYLNPTATAIGSADMAVILTAADTVVARSTGMQIATEMTYWKEYRITRSDLEKLAKSPVLKVVFTYAYGTQAATVPEKDQPDLMLWAKAFLQEVRGE